MATFYEQYLNEQFKIKPSAGEEINWGEAKNVQLKIAMTNEVQLDEFLDELGGFVEGGSAYQLNLHSAGAQAWYYESRYQDAGEDFELYAIPGITGGSTANISYLGAVLATSKYPETSFYFLKYLMDSEIPPFWGFSINREITEKQMEYFVNTAYYMRPGLKATLKDGTLPNYSVYNILETQLLRYAKDECTMEDAYLKAVKDLEVYVKQ